MVNQMAVFIENRKGRILELTKVLSKNGIDLLTLSIADTKDFGILRLVTRQNEKAQKVLREAGFTVTDTELLGVEVSDKPGGLANVLEILDSYNINVEYLYSFAHTAENNAVILFKVADEALALKVLKEKGVKIIDSLIV